MSEPRSKLTVILHADVVDSTALVQADESVAHQRIRRAFERGSQILEAYNGNVLELRGDALVAEFQRASDAVVAALAMQQRNEADLQALTDDIRPVFRIGIALGEVVVADNTVTGEGVVLAQRLEQLAKPAGVCVQGSVHDSAPSRLSLTFDDLGEQDLKGIARRTRAFSVSVPPGKDLPPPQSDHHVAAQQPPKRSLRAAPIVLAAIVAAGAGLLAWFKPWQSAEDATGVDNAPAEVKVVSERRSDASSASQASIAVLAFNNMSDDPNQEYFADGISEDLITDLSRLEDVFVIARHTSFSYKGKTVPISTIGAELGVRYVLEGSVRRAGGQLRINAQLIDAVDDSHVWAKRFDGTMDDVFGFQDEVTKQVIAALSSEFRIAPNQASVNSTSGIETSNADAYDALLFGTRKLGEARAATGLDAYTEARASFEKAIELDPEYAAPYAGLGWAHWVAAVYWFNYDVIGDRKKAWELAEKSISLQDNATARRLLSKRYLDPDNMVNRHGNEIADHAKALHEAERAAELEPNNADVLAELAQVLAFSGEVGRARIKLDQAKRLNPNLPTWYINIDATIELLLGNFEKSAKLFDQTQDDILHEATTWWHASALAHSDRVPEAKALLAAFGTKAAASGSYPTSQFAIERILPLKMTDHKDVFLEGLAKAGMPDYPEPVN